MAGWLQRGGGPRTGRRWRAGTAAALVLAGASSVVLAKSTSAPFAITVTLFPAFKDTVDCGTSRSGSSFSVNCSGPAPASPNNPRFLLQLYRDGAQVGTVDGSTLPGTVTSWKVVRIADRDFLEIVVGW
jgi:hypothetical protein